MSNFRRPLVAGVAVALTPLLGGCLAAVAIPLVAGGALSARSHAVHVRAATQARAAAATALPSRAGAPTASGGPVATTLTNLNELPPPSGAPAASQPDRWRPFFDYALAAGQAKDGLQSALLAAPGQVDNANRKPCRTSHPAVVIDLDQGREPFVPERLAPAPPDITQGLATLRQANVTVLWIARLPGGRANDVAAALKTSGRDPEGSDQLLLLRNADDRKQVLRQDAQNDVCIVAIAGDDRGDFDELFDYLRNPASAVGLYPMMGSGWFLVPEPIQGAASAASASTPGTAAP